MISKKTTLVFLCFVSILIVCIFLSIFYGARSVSIRDIWKVLTDQKTGGFEESVILMRIPRTVFGILAGAALSVSGALMQSVTRNPIADPSILGVNTGASLFIVCGIAFFHINHSQQYIWLAFAGAFLTSLLVYMLALAGTGEATPVKLAMSGAAVSIALQSLVSAVMLPRTDVMDQFRFWQVGSIGKAGWNEVMTILPYLIAGLILSIFLIPHLNTLALGDEIAVGLGVKTARIRALTALAAVLLCASSTALAGPIGFIGLMVPHMCRLLLGPDMKKVIPFSAIGGGCILLLADTAGRLLGRPGELESGIVTAFIGAPVFILIIRKVKVRSL